MELSGNNEALRRSRAAAIARGAAQYLSGWDELDGAAGEPEELWVGSQRAGWVAARRCRTREVTAVSAAS
jgi:hypothetical protein